jgi:integrase
MGDVLEMDGSFRAEVTIWRRHTKRRKTRVVLLCAELVGVLKNYLGGEVVHRDEYLFARSTGKPISRHTLYKLHRRAAMKLRLRGRVGGTHSMRKTFGEGVHDHLMGLSASGVKVDPLLGTKEAMGHSDVRSTEAYLQADSEQVTAAIGSVGRRFWGAKLANRDELEN